MNTDKMNTDKIFEEIEVLASKCEELKLHHALFIKEEKGELMGSATLSGGDISDLLLQLTQKIPTEEISSLINTLAIVLQERCM